MKVGNKVSISYFTDKDQPAKIIIPMTDRLDILEKQLKELSDKVENNKEDVDKLIANAEGNIGVFITGIQNIIKGYDEKMAMFENMLFITKPTKQI